MRQPKIGYDYVHSLVDDHSRLAYAEILPDEKGPTCAGFLLPNRLARRMDGKSDRLDAEQIARAVLSQTSTASRGPSPERWR